MKTKLMIACQVILAMFLLSCQDYKKSEDGFEYKFIVDNEGTPIETDKFVLFYADYYNDDVLMFSSAEQSGGMPGIIRVSQQLMADTTPLVLALRMMDEGDSAIFKFKASDIYEKSFQMPLPDTIKGESSVYTRFKVAHVFDPEQFEAYMEEKENAAFEEQKVEMEALLAAEGVAYETTESGLSYVILQEGDGNRPETGDMVKVHYTGTLTDGSTFDSSVDRGEPIEFPLGVGRVIKGWDEGIALLSKGAKAKFFIPSKLGYGSSGSGGRIPPNSILIFEVELVDFKKSDQ